MSDQRDIDEVIIYNVSALSFLRSFISFLRGEYSVSTELLGYSSLDMPHTSVPLKHYPQITTTLRASPATSPDNPTASAQQTP